MRVLYVALASVSAAALAVSSAAAQHSHDFPAISGGAHVELKYESFSSDDPAVDGSDLLLEAETFLLWEISPNVALRTDWKLEPQRDRDPGEERWLEDHGLSVESLYAVLTFDPVTVTAGKFAQNFQLGSELVPGVFGEEFNEETEVEERWGIGASVGFGGGDTARFDVGASVFTRDRTFLSESLGTNRGRLRAAAGGPGNTGDLDNWLVSVDVTQIPGAEGLWLHGAYMQQSAGDGDPTDQSAWYLGAVWQIEAGDGVFVTPILTYASSDDAVGFGEPESGVGYESDFVVAALAYNNGPWEGVVTFGKETKDEPPVSEEKELWQLSLAYAFSHDWKAAVAWLHEDEDGTKTDKIGLKLEYHFGFGPHGHDH